MQASKESNESYRSRKTGKVNVSDIKVFNVSKVSFKVRYNFGGHPVSAKVEFHSMAHKYQGSTSGHWGSLSYNMKVKKAIRWYQITMRRLNVYHIVQELCPHWYQKSLAFHPT